MLSALALESKLRCRLGQVTVSLFGRHTYTQSVPWMLLLDDVKECRQKRAAEVAVPLLLAPCSPPQPPPYLSV